MMAGCQVGRSPSILASYNVSVDNTNKEKKKRKLHCISSHIAYHTIIHTDTLTLLHTCGLDSRMDE